MSNANGRFSDRIVLAAKGEVVRQPIDVAKALAEVVEQERVICLKSLRRYAKARGLEIVKAPHPTDIYWRATISGPKGTATVWTALWGNEARWRINGWRKKKRK